MLPGDPSIHLFRVQALIYLYLLLPRSTRNSKVLHGSVLQFMTQSLENAGLKTRTM
nr:MAG TPA: hypothetical protein [Caudoviricetes sp.]